MEAHIFSDDMPPTAAELPSLVREALIAGYTAAELSERILSAEIERGIVPVVITAERRDVLAQGDMDTLIQRALDLLSGATLDWKSRRVFLGHSAASAIELERLLPSRLRKAIKTLDYALGAESPAQVAAALDEGSTSLAAFLKGDVDALELPLGCGHALVFDGERVYVPGVTDLDLETPLENIRQALSACREYYLRPSEPALAP